MSTARRTLLGGVLGTAGLTLAGGHAALASGNGPRKPVRVIDKGSGGQRIAPDRVMVASVAAWPKPTPVWSMQIEQGSRPANRARIVGDLVLVEFGPIPGSGTRSFKVYEADSGQYKWGFPSCEASAVSNNTVVNLISNSDEAWFTVLQTGEFLWISDLAPVDETTVVAGGEDGFFFVNDSTIALHAERGYELRWSRPFKSTLRTTPLVAADGLYVPCGPGGEVEKVDLKTGATIWRNRPVVAEDPYAIETPELWRNQLFVRSDRGSYRLLDPATGNPIRTRHFDRQVVADKEKAYLANNGVLTAFDSATGTSAWTFNPSSGLLRAFERPRNHRISVQSKNESIYLLDSDTAAVRWATRNPEDPAAGGHVAVGDTTVVIAWGKSITAYKR